MWCDVSSLANEWWLIFQPKTTESVLEKENPTSSNRVELRWLKKYVYQNCFRCLKTFDISANLVQLYQEQDWGLYGTPPAHPSFHSVLLSNFVLQLSSAEVWTDVVNKKDARTTSGTQRTSITSISTPRRLNKMKWFQNCKCGKTPSKFVRCSNNESQAKTFKAFLVEKAIKRNRPSSVCSILICVIEPVSLLSPFAWNLSPYWLYCSPHFTSGFTDILNTCVSSRSRLRHCFFSFSSLFIKTCSL